ncbi:MAG: SUMF1/EgtB/PvdO family nonheme iron enzyme [Magnetococcus sp. YQC-3]
MHSRYEDDDPWWLACNDLKQTVKRARNSTRNALLNDILDQLLAEISRLQSVAVGEAERQTLQATASVLKPLLGQFQKCDAWFGLVIEKEKLKLTNTIAQISTAMDNLLREQEMLRIEDHLGWRERLFAKRRKEAEQSFQDHLQAIEQRKALLSAELAEAREAFQVAEEEEQGVLALLQQIDTEEILQKLPKLLCALLSRGFSIGDKWHCPLTGMEFMWVPRGKFLLGDLFGDGVAQEKPVHPVSLVGFWLGKYPVTQQEWQKVMGGNPAHFKKGHHYPVENISWHDAQAFVSRLNHLGDGRYRLPTEAEWEYACRSGGGKERYAGGEEIDKSAWYGDIYGSTHPVGKKAANRLGLHDMSGNVCEWVQDCRTAYNDETQLNPLQEGNDTQERINRGGSWLTAAQHVRCSARNSNSATFRSYALGVRLARSAATACGEGVCPEVG